MNIKIFDIYFNNPKQIINMGGPWIGDLLVNNELIAEDVILDNTIYLAKSDLLYYIKKYESSKWIDSIFFRINFVNLISKEQFEVNNKFNMIFMKEISETNKLTFYEAFHDEDAAYKKELDLNSVVLNKVRD